MQVRCPQCQETFQAKGNARRIKCPSCGTREEAPEAGFAAAWMAGKPRTQFQPLSKPSSAGAGASSASPAVIWGVVAVVALLAVGGFWYFSQNGNTGVTPPGTGSGMACGKPIASFTVEDATNPVVEIDTDAGCMAAEIFSKKAPITAKNFVDYVNEGFYTNLHFYRIEPQVIQGGGEKDGEAGAHPAIKNEARTSGLKNTKYTVSMARTAAADSATTEFFINMGDNCQWDPRSQSSCPQMAVSEDGYAVFGKLVHGTDVADAMLKIVPPPGPVIKTIKVATGSGGTVTTMPSTSSSPTSTLPNPVCASVPNAAVPAPAAVEIDLITPGVWNVCGNTDSNFLWVHNNGTGPLSYTWSITGPDGAALPAGWSVTFATPTGQLAETGRAAAAYGSTMATLTIPATETARQVPAELRAGDVVRPFTFHVSADRGRVTVSGEHIQTHYDLDDSQGNAIQHNGDFCVTLGPATNAVVGYARGLIGLAKGETVTLYVPPAFAYGFGSSGLGGKTLVWAATINGYSATPPGQGSQCPQAV